MASASDGSDAVVPSPFTTFTLLPCCHHHHHHHHREWGPIKCPFPNLHNVLPTKWFFFFFFGIFDAYTHTQSLAKKLYQKNPQPLDPSPPISITRKERILTSWTLILQCQQNHTNPIRRSCLRRALNCLHQECGVLEKTPDPKMGCYDFKEWDAASKRQSYGYYCYYFWGIIGKENGNKRPQDKGKRSTMSVKIGVDHARGKERNSFFLTLRKGGISGSYLLLTRGSPCNPDCFASNPISR